MNIRDAWEIVKDGPPNYDGSEYEEMKDVIERYWAAYRIVNRRLTRRWWEFWK